MTNFEFKIPIDEEGNLVLYAHTFSSSLEPTKLGKEDPLLQAQMKIDVLENPKEHHTNKQNSPLKPSDSYYRNQGTRLTRIYLHYARSIVDYTPIKPLKVNDWQGSRHGLPAWGWRRGRVLTAGEFQPTQ